ncbi:hypothetical protein ABT115_21330 [Streptomyces sp. NPDC001832]|uniref:hypothetical protein n=1 Tax=Streptomyces sp. NPDC001832 TaxID=3154527 RepID=UPI0033185A89
MRLTMFSIEFLPRAEDGSWRSIEELGKNPRELTVDDFTFRHFVTDVLIHDQQAGDIALVTPGLPIIDFLLMLVQMKREVLATGESTVETSQTQDSIHAVRRGDSVQIHYGFSDIVSDIPLELFQEIPRIGLRAALQVLHSACAELRSNGYLQGLSRVV